MLFLHSPLVEERAAIDGGDVLRSCYCVQYIFLRWDGVGIWGCDLIESSDIDDDAAFLLSINRAPNHEKRIGKRSARSPPFHSALLMELVEELVHLLTILRSQWVDLRLLGLAEIAPVLDQRYLHPLNFRNVDYASVILS